MSRFGVLGALALGLTVVGCGKAEDQYVDSKLATIATHRSEHPHYPVMVFGDFGSDSQPEGVSVDVYGFYVHETTKANGSLNGLSQQAATAKLERTFEKALDAVRSDEAAVKPPKPPYPGTPDWKVAPHPAFGTYTIVSQCGPKPLTFNVTYDSNGGLQKVLLADAAQVVKEGLDAENAGLKALNAPPGFTLCTSEVLAIQQGSRGVEPHIIGSPLLITPIDKTLALKGFEHSIERLLKSTAQIDPAPSTVHLVVQGPGFNQTYAITLGGAEEKQGIDAAMQSLGAEIDALNAKGR